MNFGVKYFETITASMVNWFSGQVVKPLRDFVVGSRIRTIFESVAIEMEQLYYQLYIGITDGIKQAVFNTFQFPLLQAQPASGSVRFSRGQPAPFGGVTIPAGTTVSTPGSSLAVAVSYETTDTVVIAEGQTYVDALVTATVDGAVGNAPADTITVLTGSPSGVDSVTNPNDFFTGRDLETDDERMARFQTFIANLSRGTLGAIENSALRVTDVVDALASESPELSVFVYGEALDNFADISFEVGLPTGTPQRSLATAVEAGDALYVGADDRFETLQFEIDTGMVGGGFQWQYWNGTAWVLLPFSNDSTALLSRSGFLTFTRPSTWRSTKVDDVSKFWVRLLVTDPSASQVATIVEVKAPPLPGTVLLTAMSAAATLPNSLKAQVVAAVQDYRAGGIGVMVSGPVVTSQDMTLFVMGASTADPVALKASVEQSVSDFVNRYKLGRGLVLSEIVQYAKNQDSNVLDIKVEFPVDNVDASSNEVIRPGTITANVQQSSILIR